MLADAYIELGRLDAARAVVVQALTYETGNQDARARLAHIDRIR